MPYGYIEPEIFLTHRGVPVYHVYKDEYSDCRLEYWFTTSPDEHPDSNVEFDVRDLPTWNPPVAPATLRADDPPEVREHKEALWAASHASEQAAIPQAIRDAIDQGHLRLPTPAPGPPAPSDSPTPGQPPAFLIVAQLQTTEAYIQACGGPEDAASAIAGALTGLLNPPSQDEHERWAVLDATVYPLR